MGEKGQLFGPMLDAGFTVFSINHRLAPKNTIWTQVRDCQRAVQYIRHHAERWGIDAGRLGGMGHSSGASMITYLGLLDDVAVADAHDPVDRESSRLQAIVPVSGLHDFSVSAESAGGVSVFMSAVIGRPVTYQPPGHPVYETYARASTLRYASADDATALILHGTADEAVDVKHSVLLAEALTAAGVKNEFIELVGASHAVLLETVDIQPGVYAADWMKRTLIR